MCRSIKTLRPPALPEEATEDDIRAAALQYVRKVSGFRAPAAHNREVFDRAVDDIAEATARLLAGLEIRGGHPHPARAAHDADPARAAHDADPVRPARRRVRPVSPPAREPQPDAV